MADQYWVKSGDDVVGPMTGDELKELASGGGVAPDDLVGKGDRACVGAPLTLPCKSRTPAWSPKGQALRRSRPWRGLWRYSLCE